MKEIVAFKKLDQSNDLDQLNEIETHLENSTLRNVALR